MRLYSFVNSYLSPLQHGLQTAHLVAELATREHHDHALSFVDWATNHKTITILNGGNCGTLNSIIELFQNVENEYHWWYFFEDHQSLNGALTCVGIIVPEKIYEAARLLRENQSTKLDGKGVWSVEPDPNFFSAVLTYAAPFNAFEVELVKLINGCRLA